MDGPNSPELNRMTGASGSGARQLAGWVAAARSPREGKVADGGAPLDGDGRNLGKVKELREGEESWRSEKR